VTTQKLSENTIPTPSVAVHETQIIQSGVKLYIILYSLYSVVGTFSNRVVRITLIVFEFIRLIFLTNI